MTTYDAVRYSNHAYAQTHPDRLATVAVLHGLEPPDPGTARVLELGAGAGGNLLTMAAATPGLRLVGVDLAATPVAEGRAAIAELGMRNVELLQGDVRALTAGELGTFDYVIAHGVYTWVPPEAREALLAAIASHLAPEGVAYVSYNAQPGGHLRRILRDAGLFHARGIEEPAARALKAQELYRFLETHRAGAGDLYGDLLGRELPPLVEGPVHRLVHDDLGEDWDPIWFHDFAEHARRHGLAYVGEADLRSLTEDWLPSGFERELWALAGGDRIAYETYADVLTGRHFRETVLCHAGLPVRPRPEPERAARLHWAARPHAEPLEVGLVADAYAVLDERRPEVVGFSALQAALGAEEAELGAALLEGFRRERLVPHSAPLRAASEPGERPRASALVRWQASRGPEMTSLAYTTVRMEEPAARVLVTLLDGTRDRAQVRAELAERTGLELTPEDLDANLRELARLFLLEPAA